MLTDTVGIVMKFPTSDDVLKNIDPKKSEIENTYAVIAACIEQIFDTENVYETANQSKKEVQEFIDSLNKTQFDKIKNFFDKLPKLKHAVEFQCTHCGTKNDIVLQGLESFFA